MADSTVQETLLTKIPAELLEQINAAPRDLYEKVHQRELLLIEQIKHFANIRVEELANYSRNLLKQRQAEQEQEHRRRSSSQTDSTVPVLKSIVKREPSQMEKRVSFSELPPEVEEFYSNNGEDDDLYDSDDSDRRYNFKTIDSDEEDTAVDSQDLGHAMAPMVPNGDDLGVDPAGEHLSESLEESHEMCEIEDHREVSPDHSPARLSGPNPTHALSLPNSPPRLDLKDYSWTPSNSEPVISFEDAYGPQESDSEREVPDFGKEPQQPQQQPSPQSSSRSPSPQVPAGFVGSAPINIGMETLILDHRSSSAAIHVGEISDTLSPKLQEALNPENMSFSQRMAWEDRPRV